VKFQLYILALMIGFLSCNKSGTPSANNNPVPSRPVEMSLYPNDPTYFKVQFIGGWMYVSGGINGIVLYRKSEEEFVAVERTSSQLPDNAAAAVKVMSDNFTLRDSISDSHWRIFDGTVTKGPATWPLRLYYTSYDGSRLIIRN
jgi:hypothetical protein